MLGGCRRLAFLCCRRRAAFACVEARRAEPALGSPFDCFAKGMNFDYVIPLGPIVAKYFAMAIGPMLAAFVLWFVGAWIMAGFYRRRTKR